MPIVAHTIQSACETYGLSRSRLYGLLQSGVITARKLGKRTLILDDDLRKWASSLPIADKATTAALSPKLRQLAKQAEAAAA